MAGPTTVIAAFSAALQAIRTWIALRDSGRASRTAETAYRRTSAAKIAKTEAERLSRVVPDDVLKTMEQRVDQCWERFREAIDPDQGRGPKKIDEATEALKRCLCRELRQIFKLNGSVPSGKLRKWWDMYCTP